MPPPDLSRRDNPLGPLRDKFAQAIGAQDYTRETGFICQIAAPASAGTLVYRTLEGTEDQTETGLSAGDTINVGGIPVALRVVRGSSTVTSIVVGVV